MMETKQITTLTIPIDGNWHLVETPQPFQGRDRILTVNAVSRRGVAHTWDWPRRTSWETHLQLTTETTAGPIRRRWLRVVVPNTPIEVHAEWRGSTADGSYHVYEDSHRETRNDEVDVPYSCSCGGVGSDCQCA